MISRTFRLPNQRVCLASRHPFSPSLTVRHWQTCFECRQSALNVDTEAAGLSNISLTTASRPDLTSTHQQSSIEQHGRHHFDQRIICPPCHPSTSCPSWAFARSTMSEPRRCTSRHHSLSSSAPTDLARRPSSNVSNTPRQARRHPTAKLVEPSSTTPILPKTRK